MTWSDALYGRNPFAIVAFALLAHVVFSFPLTNPLQDGVGITRIFSMLTMWWFTRKAPDSHVVR